MISHIQGRLVEKHPTDVVIDCNGVGYFLHITLQTYEQLPDTESVLMYTHLQVREDAHSLYGFMTKSEREVFRLLISVSGIGAATARTMLSSLTPQEVVEAIAANDLKTLKSAKGIGIKTAQRMVLDLKDKVLKIYEIAEDSSDSHNTNREEALSALETLGFARRQAEKVCKQIVKESPDASAEMIIKLALKKL